MAVDKHRQAWEDWGSLNPLYAILTDPKYRHGGDVESFLLSGKFAEVILGEVERLGLCRKRRRALDFGCGIGRLTWVLADHFESVVGLDVASSMVERARELHRRIENCRFEVHAARDLGRFGDGEFDLVVCLLVLQHLPSSSEIVSYLREFVRVLEPEGALVVQLCAKVPTPPPTPPWRSREGLRSRAAMLLHRLGAPASLLYSRLNWVPEMTMTAVGDAEARKVFEDAGGHVVSVSEPDVDQGGTESRIYYVTR